MRDRDARGRRRKNGPEAPRTRTDAWDAAVKYLATRARTTHEVRESLVRRGYPPEDIAAVMARLTAAHYVDDADFARTWVAARAHRGAAAPARLTRELRAKGVPDGTIGSALRSLDGAWDAGAAADEAARRKMKSLGGLPIEVARRRLAAYLERRGFGRELIATTCRRWFSDPDEPE